MRPLLPLLGLMLLPTAAAQIQTELRLPAAEIQVGQKATVTFVVRNLGKEEFLFGMNNCHPNLQIQRVSDGQNMVADDGAACVGTTPPVVVVRPGFRREIALGVPPLPAGDYLLKTSFLPNAKSKTPEAGVSLRVGSAFFANLALSVTAKAGRPLPLVAQYRNVWPTTQSADVRPCGKGLQIRNVNGRVVYDTLPEKAICAKNLKLTTLGPGQTHAEPWPDLPALPAGDYTAVMWGKDHASLRFTVRK